MFIYAQLNENKICIGISSLSGEATADNMVKVDSFSEDFIWRKYENGQWSEEKFLPQPNINPTIEEQIYAENLYQTALLEMQQMLGGI